MTARYVIEAWEPPGVQVAEKAVFNRGIARMWMRRLRWRYPRATVVVFDNERDGQSIDVEEDEEEA